MPKEDKARIGSKAYKAHDNCFGKTKENMEIWNTATLVCR
jgi:hypothetical protein